MASESRMYTFSTESKEHLRKFRLSTSRASEPQAVIYFIDKATSEIKQDEDKTVYKSLEDIAEDLPDHQPRFVLLSYPLTLESGRPSSPYVLINYIPDCKIELKMLYAAAKELMRNTAEVVKVLDIKTAEELVEEVPDRLAGKE